MIEIDEISKRAIKSARRDMAKDIRRDVEMFRKLKTGTPHGPRIPAEAALIWTRQKPATPGWYAWKCNDKVYPYLTRVYLDGDTLMADMKAGSWNENHELRDISDREWFGPLPQTPPV